MMFLQRHASHLTLVALLLPVLQASAADICTWTGRDCTGLFGCCTNIEEGACCIWRTGTSLGWSVSMSKVSASGPWTAFTSFDLSCRDVNGSGAVEGPEDTACVNVPDVPGVTNYNSGRWMSNPIVEKRENKDKPHEPCHTIDTVGYHAEDGRKHTFKVPEGDGQLELADFVTLSMYGRV